MSMLETKPPKPLPSERIAPSRHPHALSEHDLPTDLPQTKTVTVIVMAAVFAAAMAGLFFVGWLPHHRAAEQAVSDAAEQSSGEPAVSITLPKTAPASKDVFLPADIRANQQTAIYSRANGFIKSWLVDVGAHVKRGQLLAVIDTPDVDAQLNQSKAALEQAKANVIKDEADLQVAQTDYDRYLKTQKENPGSVTQEEVDAKRDARDDAAGALAVGKAAVTQAEATVQQETVLQGFEQIPAPFDGVITARNYDVGALINPANPGKELFDIADVQTLRVYVDVPQTYTTDIHVGQPAYLSVRNYPGREFTGTVGWATGALDTATRTSPFELDFVNKDGSLMPGMYGQARLPVGVPRPVLTIPSSAMVFNSAGTQVAVLRDGKVHYQKITVGRDLGTELEISDGLLPDDEVIVNPGERLSEGVSVKATPAAKN
jgi:RND family efflux transporter MFP subunit